MDRSLPDVTEAEAAVLQQLWDSGPASVRQLRDALYPRGGASEHATVHKLLERLEAKGYVERERAGGTLRFQAAVDREQAFGRQLEALLAKMGGGSLQPLLTGLVRAKRITAEELRELLHLVEDLERQKRPKKDRG